MIVGVQFEPFVIPCKPTSPNVRVELIREDGEVNIISFNDTSGFLVVSNDTVTFGDMVCEFTSDNTKQKSEHFFVIDRRFTLFRPFEGIYSKYLAPMFRIQLTSLYKGFSPALLKIFIQMIAGISRIVKRMSEFNFLRPLLLEHPASLILSRMCLKLFERCKLKLVYKDLRNTFEYYATHLFMNV